MHPALNIAINAAREAGDILLRYTERLDRILIKQKSKQNYYSEVDIKAEEAVIKILSKSFPDHGIIAEESGYKNDNADYVWIIDPLDGTTNYIHSYPNFCVSIALKHKDKIECGVVFDPLRKECFTAARGQGARVNDRRLRVTTKKTELHDALIGTNYSFKETLTPSLDALFKEVAGIRKLGTAALELAYVAAGRIDGFIGYNLCPWDVAAASLLIQEAGGLTYDLTGENDILPGHIMAANPKIFKEISNLLENRIV